MVIAWHRLSTTGEDDWDELDADELYEKYEEVIKSGELLSSAKRGELTDIEEIDVVAGDHHYIFLKMGQIHRTHGPIFFPEDYEGDLTDLCTHPSCVDEWRQVYAFGFDLQELLDRGAFVGPDIIEGYLAILSKEPWYRSDWPEELPKRLLTKIKKLQKKSRLYGEKAFTKMKSLYDKCKEILRKDKSMWHRSKTCVQILDGNEVGVPDTLPLHLAKFVIVAGVIYQRPY